MALEAGVIEVLPDLACIGLLSEVGEDHVSKTALSLVEAGQDTNTVNHVIPFKTDNLFAGPKESTFYFVYEPAWFGKKFDLSSLKARDRERVSQGNKPYIYGKYCQLIVGERDNLGRTKRPSVLQNVAGCMTRQAGFDPEGFERLKGAFEELRKVDGASVAAIFQSQFVGKVVGYVLEQRVDKDEETGESVLTNDYNIKYFFIPTEEAKAAMVRAANKAGRKKPMRIMWAE